jgi:transcriptional regulator with XRE-family HTH domain
LSDPNFGDRVYEARNELGWTQPELSEETRKFGSKEIHLNTICALETGRTRGSLVTRRILNATITAALRREYPWKDDGDAINNNSLAKFIKDSALVNRIDHDYSKAKNPALRVVFSEEFVDFFVERMRLVKIETFQPLEEHLKRREDILTKFGVCWFKSSMNVMHFVPRGISISFLSNLLVLEKDGVKGLTKFLEQHRFAQDRDPLMLARGVKAIYDEARNELRAEH